MRYLPVALLSAGLCCAHAQAQEPAQSLTPAGEASATAKATGFEDLKVLQSIQSGLWQVSSREEPAPKKDAKPRAPEQGCLSAQNVAEDLRAFLTQEDEMTCKGQLQTNTDELAVLQVSCPAPIAKKKLAAQESLFRTAPSVIEVRRFSNTRFQVVTKISSSKIGGKKAATQEAMVQDYERLDDCPW